MQRVELSDWCKWKDRKTNKQAITNLHPCNITVWQFKIFSPISAVILHWILWKRSDKTIDKIIFRLLCAIMKFCTSKYVVIKSFINSWLTHYQHRAFSYEDGAVKISRVHRFNDLIWCLRSEFISNLKMKSRQVGKLDRSKWHLVSFAMIESPNENVDAFVKDLVNEFLIFFVFCIRLSSWDKQCPFLVHLLSSPFSGYFYQQLKTVAHIILVSASRLSTAKSRLLITDRRTVFVVHQKDTTWSLKSKICPKINCWYQEHF